MAREFHKMPVGGLFLHHNGRFWVQPIGFDESEGKGNEVKAQEAIGKHVAGLIQQRRRMHFGKKAPQLEKLSPM